MILVHDVFTAGVYGGYGICIPGEEPSIGLVSKRLVGIDARTTALHAIKHALGIHKELVFDRNINKPKNQHRHLHVHTNSKDAYFLLREGSRRKRYRERDQGLIKEIKEFMDRYKDQITIFYQGAERGIYDPRELRSLRNEVSTAVDEEFSEGMKKAVEQAQSALPGPKAPLAEAIPKIRVLPEIAAPFTAMAKQYIDRYDKAMDVDGFFYSWPEQKEATKMVEETKGFIENFEIPVRDVLEYPEFHGPVLMLVYKRMKMLAGKK